jgi:hypothetical protein
MTSEYPLLRVNKDGIYAITHALIGARLSLVEYRQTRHGGLLEVPDAIVHEIELNALLATSKGVFNVTWERDDLIEGISVSLLDSMPSTGDALGVDVTGSPQWLPFIDQEIVNVEFAWQVSEAGCPESLWAIRLDFAHGASVILALGEVDEPLRPQYFPDSLIVIFNEQVARSYVHAGASGSAWA